MAEENKKSQIWMRNLLLGSLGLNVFLAGFLFAKIIGPEAQDPNVQPIQFTLGSLPSDMPIAIREGLEDNFKLHSAEVREKYKELNEVRLRVGDILGMEELDQVALQRALEEIRELQLEIQIPMHQVLVEAAADLDAKTRRELLFPGTRLDARGLWGTRQFDGARWKVEYDNGEIVLNFQGITDGKDEDDPSEE